MYGVSPGERLRYYPYGEERPGATTQGREKFATYLRDANGIDYAMNRYYASATGRFLTPDPYESSAGLGDPQSWNRYT
jgi:RHS repeat-associated protein